MPTAFASCVPLPSRLRTLPFLAVPQVTVKKVPKGQLGGLAVEMRSNFMQNLSAMLKKYGTEVGLPAVESELDDVLSEDYAEYKFKRCWAIDVDGTPADRLTLRIYENCAKRGCDHCSTSKWGETPRTIRTYHVM